MITMDDKNGEKKWSSNYSFRIDCIFCRKQKKKENLIYLAFVVFYEGFVRDEKWNFHDCNC